MKFPAPSVDIDEIKKKYHAIVAEEGDGEQGRRKSTGPAKALLRILEADPEGAVRALHHKSA